MLRYNGHVNTSYRENVITRVVPSSLDLAGFFSATSLTSLAFSVIGNSVLLCVTVILEYANLGLLHEQAMVFLAIEVLYV